MGALFAFAAPAAKLMPVHLPQAAPLRSGDAVPREWLAVDQYGTAGRFNAGVCLLEPCLELLVHI
eukprot:4036087-Alexandrium_andersonii.AAC.1